MNDGKCAFCGRTPLPDPCLVDDEDFNLRWCDEDCELNYYKRLSQPPTLRDRFAMEAFAGFAANIGCNHWDEQKLVKRSFDYADAMMAERERRQKGGE